MSLRYLALAAALVATATLALGAATASSGASTQPQAANGAQQVGTLTVRFTIQKFVKRAGRLYAVGAAITQFTPAVGAPENLTPASTRKAFVTRVKGLRRFSSAQKICPILDLTLGPLDLNLLGLMVHLDTVHLTITADSEGGLLGSLLCSLAGRGGGGPALGTLKAAKTPTEAAHRSGLSTKGVRVAVPLYQTTSGSGTTTLSTTKSPMVICTVLDLKLGPLDLNLLGLMVHLSGAAPTDPVHLLITADSE